MKLVEFPLERGGNVLVQVADSAPQAPTTRGLGSQQVRERAQQTFEQAVDAVRPAAEALINRLRATGMPDEVAIEFGLELSAEAGAFIASTSTTANFKVSLIWRPPQSTG
jgi:hypothetical protein